MSTIGRRWLDGETVAVFHSDGSLVIETPCGDIEIDRDGATILSDAIRHAAHLAAPTDPAHI